MVLAVGDKAPSFKVATDGGETISSSGLKGASYVVYFYPKDDTSGCTKQAIGFSDSLKKFDKLGVTVIGISKDSVAKHDKFKKKYELPFTLASDEHGHVCEDYGTWKEKSMYGRTYMGIERTTFLIGADGVIKQVWNKVKVTGHVAEVLKAADARLRGDRPPVG